MFDPIMFVTDSFFPLEVLSIENKKYQLYYIRHCTF